MRDQTKEQALFEHSPIPQAVARLAFPTVIGQIIMVVYNIADTFFIGLTGSDAMVTAVTICMPAFMILSAISNLFGIGGASVMSRAMGARMSERARRTASFALWGCLSVSLLYIAGVWACKDWVIDALGGSEPAVHAYASDYLMTTVVAGGIFASMSALLAHLVRAEGRSVSASVGIALGGVLNMALDPLFMFVILPAGNEVLGAAVATALSNVVSLMYFAVVFRMGRGHSALNARITKEMLQDGIPQDVFNCGLPACLMTLMENVSYAVLDNLMALGGVAVQAGIGVAKKLNMLAHCIVRGMSQGVLPLISYNYAAGNDARVKKTVAVSMSASVTLSALCMAVCLAFNRQLVGAFIQNGGESVEYGAQFLRILCLGAPFSACAYALISFFQAVGCGMKSFVLAVMRKGVLDIPLMFILARLDSTNGVVWATPIADVLCSVAAVCLFVSFLRSQERDSGRRAPIRACSAALSEGG